MKNLQTMAVLAIGAALGFVAAQERLPCWLVANERWQKS